MNTITIAWIGVPFFLGFIIFIIPTVARYFALLGAIISAGYAIQLFQESSPVTLNLLDHFGVR